MVNFRDFVASKWYEIQHYKCYNIVMYNWSVDTSRLKKDSKKYKIFKLEQAINFGLNNTKLSLKSLKEHFDILKIDPNKRAYLKMLLSPIN